MDTDEEVMEELGVEVEWEGSWKKLRDQVGPRNDSSICGETERKRED